MSQDARAGRGPRLTRLRTIAVLGAVVAVIALVAGVALAAPTSYPDRSETITFPQGDDSFADQVVSFNRATNANGSATTNGVQASTLGAPDGPDNTGATAASPSLGDGGSMTLRWTDNALTGSGNANPDLHIYERGTQYEDTHAWVSPDGTNYTYVGRTTGGQPGKVNIDAVPATQPDGSANRIYDGTPGGVAATGSNGFGVSARLTHVRVLDVTGHLDNGGAFAGADIDAVGAIETVLLNDAPVNTVPAAQTTNEDTARVFSAANANAITVADRDSGSNPVRVTLTVPNGTLTPGATTTGVTATGSATGTLTLTGTVANLNTALNGLTFTPAANYNGATTLTVTTNDQGNSIEGANGLPSDVVVKEDVDTVGITVSPINDAPVNGVPAAQTTNENTALLFNNTNGNRVSIADVDVASGQVQLRLRSTSGTATLSQTTGLTFQTGTNGTADFTVRGTLANVNAALDGLRFTPSTNFTGNGSVRLTTDDRGNTGTGGILTDDDTISVKVNDNPTIAAVTNNGPRGEGTPVTITVTATDTDSVAGNRRFEFDCNDDGDYADAGDVGPQAANTAQCTFPDNGTSRVNVRVTDGEGGSATGFTNVVVTNVAPDAVNDTANAVEDGSDVTIDVLANDADVPADPRTITVNTQPLAGQGTVTCSATQCVFNPSADFNGTTSFQYTISDGDGGVDVATVTVTVAAVNDPPVLALPGGAVAYSENAAPAVIDGGATVADVDSANFDTGTLTVDLSANGTADDRLSISPGGGIAVAGNAVSYLGTQIGTFAGGTGTTPLVITLDADATQLAVQALARRIAFSNVSDDPATAARTVRFVVTDGDGGTSAALSETINLTAADDVPTVSDIADRTILEDTDTGDVAFTVGDPDSSGLTVTGTSSDTTLVPGGNIDFGGSGANRTVKVTPAANRFGGPVTVTVRVSDGNGSSTDTFEVNVTPVNDAPSFDLTASPNQTVNEDAGDQTAANFATNASAGPFETQNVTFEVTGNSNPSLFAAAPGIAANGSLTYRPAANAVGTATVTVRAKDDGGTANGGVDVSATRTFTITVNPVNDAPTADPDAKSTPEDTDLVFPASDLTANDSKGPSDESAQALTVTDVSVIAGQTHGTVSLSGGQVTYRPDANYNGPASFRYRVCDSGDPQECTVDVARVDVEITPVNDPPTANDDTPTTAEDTDQTINVLANDTDPEGNGSLDPASVSIVSGQGPANGTATANANGTITYSPDPDFTGTDSFDYRVCDDADPALCDEARVTVTVTPVNDAPVVTNPAAISVTEDVASPLSGIAFTDLDAGSQPTSLTLSVPNGQGTLSASSAGGVTVSGSGSREITLTGARHAINDYVAADRVSFTSAANATSPVTLTIVADDNANTGSGGAKTDTETTTLNVASVNDAPVNSVSGPRDTDEDAPLVVSDLSVSDVDAGSAEVRFALSVTHGKLTLSRTTGLTFTDGADGEPSMTFTGTLADANAALDGLRFEPVPDYNGPAQLTLVTNDQGNTGSGGEQSDTDTVGITVNPVNDGPDAVDDPAAAMSEDTDQTFSVLGNDTDPEGNSTLDPASVRIVTGQGPAHGTATANADGTISYSPDPNFNGTDSFRYEVCDDANPALCDEAQVTVTVGAVNDAPTADPDAKSTPEDTDLVFPASDLTANDSKGPSDESAQALTVTDVSVIAGQTHGTVSLSGGQVTYRPDANYNGPASFRYRVCDSGNPQECTVDVARVDVSVSAVNRTPVADDETESIDEDSGPLAIDLAVLASDSETADQNLTYAIVSGPSAAQGTLSGSGSTRSFTPAPNYSGAVTIDYRVTDRGDPDNCSGAGCAAAKSDVGRVTITVTPVNDAPVADPDGPYPATEDTTLNVSPANGVLNGDTDPESTPLVADPVSGPSRGNLTLNPDGSFSYAPAPDDSGPVTFVYRACEQGSNPLVCSANRTVTIEIDAVDDGPSLEAIGDKTILEDEDTGEVELSISDLDTPLGGLPLAGLTLAGSSSNQAIVPDSGVTFGGTGTNRTVKVKPAANRFGGPVRISVTVAQPTLPGGPSVTRSFDVNVTPVNDAPSFTKGQHQTVTEDSGPQSVPGWATGILKGPFEDQSVGFQVTTDDDELFATGGQPAIAPNGTLTYTPAPNTHGTAVVKARAVDDGGTANGGVAESALETFEFTMNSVNDGPMGMDDAKTTESTEPLVLPVGDVLGNDTEGAPDEADQSLTVTEVGQAVNGVVTLNGRGTPSTADTHHHLRPHSGLQRQRRELQVHGLRRR